MIHKHPDEAVGTHSLIGFVIRALRTARGIGVNQLGNAVGLEPANLSRFERGLPGGVHTTKYLDLIAAQLGTYGSVLYTVAEMAGEDPSILKHADKLAELVDRLTRLLKNYLHLPGRVQREIDRIIAEHA
jgi:transcriptional regulator with XRE-family HTH domain